MALTLQFAPTHTIYGLEHVYHVEFYHVLVYPWYMSLIFPSSVFPRPGAKSHYMPSQYLRMRLHS